MQTLILSGRVQYNLSQFPRTDPTRRPNTWTRLDLDHSQVVPVHRGPGSPGNACEQPVTKHPALRSPSPSRGRPRCLPLPAATARIGRMHRDLTTNLTWILRFDASRRFRTQTFWIRCTLAYCILYVLVGPGSPARVSPCPGTLTAASPAPDTLLCDFARRVAMLACGSQPSLWAKSDRLLF